MELWLADHEPRRIDAALADGYALTPPGPEERAWAEISLEGLALADLDW